MPNLFIDRPISAWVIVIIIMLTGGLAILKLSMAQYPTIAPSTIMTSASYPGVDAKTVQDMVTQVIEQNINGIDNLVYMPPNSDSTGIVQITLAFESNTDADITQVQTQNRLQLVMPLPPQEAQQQEASIEKSSSSFLMIVGATNTDGTMTQGDTPGYVAANVRDATSRTSGTGDVQLFDPQYAMRIWTNLNGPNKFQPTPVDVIIVTKVQNARAAVGQLGSIPSMKGQQSNASIAAQTHLTSIKEFGKILLKMNQDGPRVLLRDAAKIELGGENYDIIAGFNSQSASGLGIKLATGTNALSTAVAIRVEPTKMRSFFSLGPKIAYPYDTTPFVKTFIHEVVKVLVRTIILVFLVIYLFLQNFRTTLIPTIAVSVVLLGTFAILAAFGFSVSTLTMLGVVLAIGLLVDGAIAMIEDTERVMVEGGLSPKGAVRKPTGQIQDALVGITMVLLAVFIPMVFFSGFTGAIHRQFSITIAPAVAPSVLVALILTLALCATMLKPIAKGDYGKGKRGFLGWFDCMFEKNTHHYTDNAGGILHNTGRYLVLYLIVVVGMAYLFIRLPSSFLPDEDQGAFMIMVQLSADAAQEHT